MELNVSFALLLATLAGLSTGIGSVISLFFCRPKCSQLALILGFSAGVMIYISFAELLPAAVQQVNLLTANVGFFAGIAFIAILDMVIPHEYKEERVGNPAASLASAGKLRQRRQRRETEVLLRTGTLTALGIAIHNFPEGLVVFSSAVGGDVRLGLVVAIAVGLHNIPEGISVFVPVYEASHSRRRAFLYSISAGLVEPLGALIGYAILLPFLTPTLVSSLLAFAAGIMVYISLDELLPAAHRYGKPHMVITGVVAGMLIMAVSQLLIK